MYGAHSLVRDPDTKPSSYLNDNVYVGGIKGTPGFGRGSKISLKISLRTSLKTHEAETERNPGGRCYLPT